MNVCGKDCANKTCQMNLCALLVCYYALVERYVAAKCCCRYVLCLLASCLHKHDAAYAILLGLTFLVNCAYCICYNRYEMKKPKDRHSVSKLLYGIAKLEGYKLEHFSYSIDSYSKRPGDFYAFLSLRKRLICNGSLEVSPTFFEAYFNHSISYPIAEKYIALYNRAKRLKCVFKSKKLLLEAYMRSKGIRTLPELELKLAMAGC